MSSKESSVTQPDLKAAGRFAACITGDKGAAVTFQVFKDRKGDGFPWHDHGTLKELAPRLVRAQQNDCGVFLTINRTDGEGREADNVTHALASFLDMDGAPLPERFEVEPHLINETSPGRFHVFWLIKPDEDLARFRAMQARLAAYYGGDPTIHDPSRVMRVPGFWHMKGKPFQVRAVKTCSFEQAELDGLNRYTFAELEDAHPCEFAVPELRSKATRVVEPAHGFDNSADIKQAIRYLVNDAPPAIQGESGDKRTFETACMLRDFGLSEGMALELMEEHYNPRCEPRWETADDAPRQDRLSTKVRNAFNHASGDAGAKSVVGEFDAADEEAAPDEESENAWMEGGDVSISTEMSLVELRGLKINSNTSKAADTFDNALAAVYACGLAPAFNELKQNVVFATKEIPWPEDYGRVLTDHVERLARTYLINKYQGVDYVPSKDHLHEAIMTIAYGNKFNPVLEYLDSLKWDGTPRVARLFSDYFNCGDDAYVRGVSKAFMIGAVRRMRRPGCKFDTMPVLKSPQGWLKSSAVRVLFGGDWYSDAELGNLAGKDSALALRGIWVQEFAEIDAIARADSNTLKAFISRATDRIREPYGRVVEDSPRRCVFVGTVNEGGYLKDSTGARRFWPLDVRKPIDAAKLTRDRDQLWAEAAALEAAGESLELPRELWHDAGERQAAQSSADPWADTLRSFVGQRKAAYERADAADADAGEDGEGLPILPPDRVHSSELFDALGIAIKDQTKDKSQRLRVVMESLVGWHYYRAVRVGDAVSSGYTRERLAIKVRPKMSSDSLQQ